LNTLALQLEGVVGRRLTVTTATTAAERMRGLLGQAPLRAGQAMLLRPCRLVHTFCMAYPIDLVFIDRAGVIRRIDTAVPRSRVRGCIGAWQTLEMAAGDARAHGLHVGQALPALRQGGAASAHHQHEHQHRRQRQRGQSMVEFLVIYPGLVMLLFGIIQWSLIYQARSVLNHATLLAARAGALHHGSRDEMRKGLAAGLTPLFATEASEAGYLAARARAFAEIGVAQLASFEIVNPTAAAFNDFGQPRLDGAGSPTDREIPNDTLNYRSTRVGAASGVSVQDANLLHVRVSYCFRLIVPVVGRMIHTVSNALTPFDHSLQAHGMSDPFGIGTPTLPVDSCTRPLVQGPRIRIESEAVVRMQSPFFRSNL
jgi:uncharacterized membrane protein (UPF0127 family)